MAEKSSSEEQGNGATTSRRRFLAGSAGLTGFALAAGALQTAQAAAAATVAAPAPAPPPPPPPGASPKPPPPSPVQGATDGRLVGTDFFLVLNGQNGFALQGIDGGVISSDVVVEKVGADHIAKKHIAGVKYEDITVSCGFDQPSSLYSWLAATMDGKVPPLDGTVIGAQSNHSALTRLDWSNGFISEIGFPALDATAKDAAKMTIKFHPEATKITPASGTVVPPPAKVQKKWLPANFRLSIDGLDAPCSKVNKIEALVMHQSIAADPSGTPTVSVDIPNLVITLPENVAQPFIDWHESFVVQGGNNSGAPDSGERNGTLVYFATDGTQLGQLSFSNLGIVQVTDDPTDATVRRVKAEMYCERISLK